MIESELFGHTRGSYTGANADRVGFFEASGPLGTVFLDEIGDVSAEIQVKLLRVLQARLRICLAIRAAGRRLRRPRLVQAERELTQVGTVAPYPRRRVGGGGRMGASA